MPVNQAEETGGGTAALSSTCWRGRRFAPSTIRDGKSCPCCEGTRVLCCAAMRESEPGELLNVFLRSSADSRRQKGHGSDVWNRPTGLRPREESLLRARRRSGSPQEAVALAANPEHVYFSLITMATPSLICTAGLGAGFSSHPECALSCIYVCVCKLFTQQ